MQEKQIIMKVKRKKISRIDVVRELSGYSRATVYMAYQGHSDNAKVLGIIDIIDEEERDMWERVRARVKGRKSQNSDDISGMNL